MSFEARLRTLGIELPTPPAPVASYVPTVMAGGLLVVSGQLPMTAAGLMHPGRVGAEVSLADAVAAARQCGLNLLAQARAALGSLDRVEKVVRLGVFVACVDGFGQQPEVANGASDLMAEVFGEAGRHARAAVGTNALPRGACVEVEAMFAVIPA
jgi:enamine deaminase RidA (YjgF/YER057c/UK114 family)